MDLKIVALVLILLAFLFRGWMAWLDRKSVERPVPDNVRDVYDGAEYRRWLNYQGEKGRLAFFRLAVGFVANMLIVGFGVYSYVAGLFPQGGYYLAAVAVLVADLVISLVLSVPFDYVGTMGIEQKYGFNRAGKGLFAADMVRNTLLELVLECGLCCLFIFLHQTFGNWLLLVFTVVLLVLMLAIAFLYPVIARISNKFEPLPEGELRERLMKLMADNSCTVREIKVMDGSRRTSKANAYFSGLGRSKTIVLYDTLLEQLTPEEIVAVFAHEMGHNKHKDTLKMYVMNIVSMAVMVVLAWALVSVPDIYRDFGFDGVNYGFAFFLLTTVCLPFLSPLMGLASNRLSRRNEYAADRFAARQGYGPALASALKKLCRNSLDCLNPHPTLVALAYSHPTVSQRVAAIEKQ